ncbi:MAG TPA: ThuA domain-containing protein [Mycobacteriales bacterium]|nr:ThuA domain-containing protein [Mycobacteriales bacterium]
MTSVLILTGSGRYSDRWHDHAGTSQQVAETLSEIGYDCRIRETRRPAFDQIADADLVVVNCGCGRIDPDFDGSDEDWKPALDAVAGHIRSGRGVLALHTACNTFHALPEWFGWLGAEWIPGKSMHPPISRTTVQVNTGAHPIVADLADFSVFDERYSYLVPRGDIEPLVTHEHDGIIHPLVWAREIGTARVVFDALGHGVESYASPERRELLQNEARWALG